MEINEILKERERIKQIINRKLKELVDLRKKAHRRYTLENTMYKLEDNINFLIDNPDYKRINKSL